MALSEMRLDAFQQEDAFSLVLEMRVDAFQQEDAFSLVLEMRVGAFQQGDAFNGIVRDASRCVSTRRRV